VKLGRIHHEDIPAAGAAFHIHRGLVDDLNAGGSLQLPGRPSERVLGLVNGDASRWRCRRRERLRRARFGRRRLAAQGTERVDAGEHADNDDRSDDEPGAPQLTAFFRSLTIFFSSTGVNFLSAKEVGHMAPSSRFA
jgi:hypothetical protein